jgi:hypothetical protein
MERENPDEQVDGTNGNRECYTLSCFGRRKRHNRNPIAGRRRVFHMVDRTILNGVIDIHVHPGPSVSKRALDTAEMLWEAQAAGYRAFIAKDHYIPTMTSAAITEKYMGNGTTRVFGGLVLNNSVDAFNLNITEVALKMDAKTIWMPTLSARQGIGDANAHFPGKENLTVPETPIYYLTDSGVLLDDVIELLKLMARYPNVPLATGHGSVAEIDALLKKAFELGVKKIIVNHPFLITRAEYDDVERWAKMGAYIELTASVFEDVIGLNMYPLSLISDYMEFVPPEQLIICSDCGVWSKRGYFSPVESLYKFICLMVERLGISLEQIDLMAKQTPAMLMGLT